MKTYSSDNRSNHKNQMKMKTNNFHLKENKDNPEKDTTFPDDEEDESFYDYKKCANCEIKFWQIKNVHVPFKELFHDTCIKCIQTCSVCGGEIGYVKDEHLLSHKACDTCSKEPCISCGVTIYCEVCGICCCEDCIENNENEMICAKMIEKKKKLKEYK